MRKKIGTCRSSSSEQVAEIYQESGVVELQAPSQVESAFSRRRNAGYRNETVGRPGCRKRRFRDLDEAKMALRRIENLRRTAEFHGGDIGDRREKRAYLCERCKGAHLTSWSSENGGSRHAA